MTQTNQTPALAANSTLPTYDSAYPAGDRGGGGGGGDYTFSGSGFGTKSSTAIFENFDSRATGAASTPYGDLNLSLTTGMEISTGRAYSGTKSLINTSYTTNYFPKPYIRLSGTRSRVCYNEMQRCWVAPGRIKITERQAERLLVKMAAIMK